MKRSGNELVRAGEIPAMKKLAKQYAPPTRAQLGLTEAAAAIRENPDAAEIAFMVRQLILCTLAAQRSREAQAPSSEVQRLRQ